VILEARYYRSSKKLGYRLSSFSFVTVVLIWIHVETIALCYPPNGVVCRNNLKQISLAILNYESNWIHLPPPYSTDANGKPLLSWRVMILPFIEQGALYEQFDLTKPWDDPVNLKLVNQMPDCFRCPADKLKTSDMTTSYLAVVGDRTPWPKSGKRRLRDITDGQSNTILLIESDAHRQIWTKPGDLDLEIAMKLLNEGSSCCSSNHHGGAMTVISDGSVRWNDGIDLAELAQMLLIDDGSPKTVPQSPKGFNSVGLTGFDSLPSINWQFKLLTVDANEGVDLADLNRDGLLDVVAGRNWYAAPDFVPKPVRTVEDWSGYVESNGDFMWDVDQDGWTDVIAGSFLPTAVYWYKNPGEEGLRMGRLWEKHLLMETGQSQNEAQLLQDLDGDGRPEWIVNSWAKESPLAVWKFVDAPENIASENSEEVKMNPTGPAMEKIVIGSKGQGHGMGIGDLDGDSDFDVLVGTGWYENPDGKTLRENWNYHPDWDLTASIPMLVHDLDGDGRNDIVVGQGHDFGLSWWRQTEPAADRKLTWQKTDIDSEYSQPHCLHLADLDGDGQQELISGKRWYAHNCGDPGGQMPPCMYYYKWKVESQTFERHTIDEGHIGTGLQIRTGDLNNDGLIDIAVAGKSGTYLIFQKQ
jgi:hypothetical protein